MKIGGCKTASVFMRYDIVSEADLDEAAERLNEKRRRLAEKQSSENDSRSAQTQPVAEYQAIQ
jgi:hypothetical protein